MEKHIQKEGVHHNNRDTVPTLHSIFLANSSTEILRIAQPYRANIILPVCLIPLHRLIYTAVFILEVPPIRMES